ncbi:hypothetical protein LPB144_01255 [Christiangramia salexigens]|uniref:Uncharacterized protein n=2 Tax=Christiangramia salexigens TaxID=1913577 RepID=A0A1L3J1W9_9FLAO|nr:hypothetical protein LPB144_01255 [Christiangramia salexigens]
MLLFSCSQDNISTEMEEEAKLNLEEQVAQGMYDNSNLGIYEGLFTTTDGQNRARVLIEIDGKNKPLAAFNFPDGELSSFRSQENMTKAKGGKLHFSGENFSFDFSVNEDGSNPVVTNVEFAGKKGDILIAKETSKAPIETKTGTYTCETGCFTDDEDPIPHPELGAPGATQTFSFMLQGNPVSNGSVVDVQFVLNTKTYTGQAKFNNCKNFDTRGDYTICGLFAEPNLNGRSGPIRFRSNLSQTSSEMKHVFDAYKNDPEPDFQCSSYYGTAYYNSTIFGRSTMSVITDNALAGPGNTDPNPDCYDFN